MGGILCRHRAVRAAVAAAEQAELAAALAAVAAAVAAEAREEEEEGVRRRRRAGARLAWRRAARRVLQILRLRRRWADLGQWLQQPWVQSLVAGLERRRGVLVRVRTAASAEQLRAARRR